MKTTPHSYRRMGIHAWFLAILALMAIIAASCRPQKGCYGTRGMSGYGWIKNRNTNKVFILDSTCKVICIFKDGTNMMHSKQTF